MNSEMILRVVAACIALAVLAYPYASEKLKNVLAGFRRAEPSDVKSKMKDIEYLVSLSDRLESDGYKGGPELCKKLIDVILAA